MHFSKVHNHLLHLLQMVSVLFNTLICFVITITGGQIWYLQNRSIKTTSCICRVSLLAIHIYLVIIVDLEANWPENSTYEAIYLMHLAFVVISIAYFIYEVIMRRKSHNFAKMLDEIDEEFRPVLDTESLASPHRGFRSSLIFLLLFIYPVSAAVASAIVEDRFMVQPFEKSMSFIAAFTRCLFASYDSNFCIAVSAIQVRFQAINKLGKSLSEHDSGSVRDRSAMRCIRSVHWKLVKFKNVWTQIYEIDFKMVLVRNTYYFFLHMLLMKVHADRGEHLLSTTSCFLRSSFNSVFQISVYCYFCEQTCDAANTTKNILLEAILMKPFIALYPETANLLLYLAQLKMEFKTFIFDINYQFVVVYLGFLVTYASTIYQITKSKADQASHALEVDKKTTEK